MNHSFQVYFSNRVEELFIRLKEVLYAPPSTPFTRRLIIVPSPAIKSWLMLQLAQDCETGIAAGLEIAHLDQSILELRDLFGRNAIGDLPNALELSLAIEWSIRQQLLDPSPDSLWQPLMDYLQHETGQALSAKSGKRLTALSEKMAHFFLQYGKYAGRMVEEWERMPEKEWQQALWNKLFGAQGAWSYLHRELAVPLESKIRSRDLAVHVFSMSFVPGVQHRFLQQLSAVIPIHYYLLSPCQAFWSDIRSERETRNLKNYWKRHDAAPAQLVELDVYLKDCNPLLANFGRLGREMALQVEQSAAVTAELYWLPSSVQTCPQYAPWLDGDIAFSESATPLTILQAIQADMLLMRSPTSKIAFSSYDASVQIHAAPTRLREVEALYDTLLSIIDTESHRSSPVTPGDILVMAPDIMEYEPLIKMVFGASDSLLDAQIMDLRVLTQNAYVQGFLHLLQLPFGRWDAATVLQLFHCPAFQKQQRWSAEELRQIEKWMKECGVNWGLDSSHRDEILRRAHCPQGLIDNCGAGTWEFAFSRLLMGLAMKVSEGDPVPIVPLEGIDMTQGVLIGQWIHLMRTLRKDLKPLSDGSQLTLKEWSRYLKTLYKTYFCIEREEDDAGFLQQLDAFENAAGVPLTALFAFSSIKQQLENLLSKQTVTYRESHLQAVKFCTLLPMRTVPAKVVALIGMNEGAFPKRDQMFTLNRLQGNPKADYAPSQTDFDRYLFLEALLSARHAFILSYTNMDADDFKEQSASLLVTELLNYMDKSYAIAGQTPSTQCFWTHPFNAFDKKYFAPGSLYRSYSQRHYQNACAFYHVVKTPPYRFIPHYDVKQSLPELTELKIDLKDLYAFAKNPLKTYFTKTLGIYIEKASSRQWEEDEKLQLDRLEHGLLRNEAIQKGVQRTLDFSERLGRLPFGMFKEVSINKVMEEVEAWQEKFADCQIDPSHLFHVELSQQYTVPSQLDERRWAFPALPLEVDGRHVQIVGKVPLVSPSGLVILKKKDSKEIIRYWPQCLAYSCLVQSHALDWESYVYFAKDGTRVNLDFLSPFLAMQKYVRYYLHSLDHVSPLLPEWVPLILNDDVEQLERKMEELFNKPFQELYNDYLFWSYPEFTVPDATRMQQWKELAQDLYGEALKQRAKRKKS